MAGMGTSIVDPDTYVTGVPYEELAALRDSAAVVWLEEPAVDAWPAGPGFWAVLRHAEVRQVLRNPAVFSSQLGATQIRDPATPEALAYVSQFIEEAKAAGLVRKAFDEMGLKNSQVAPAGMKP